MVRRPAAHPDALRRFRIVENVAELEAALDAPWEKWAVFLHPAQREIVEREFAGPARVVGSAGTGKTVVALHRAAHYLRRSQDVRVLLATFSEPLANAPRGKIGLLAGPDRHLLDRVAVTSFLGIAEELYQLVFGRKVHLASRDIIRSLAAVLWHSGASAQERRSTDFIVRLGYCQLTSVAFFEFQIYTANQREGASLPLARS